MVYRTGLKLHPRQAEAGILTVLLLHGTILVATGTVPTSTATWLIFVAVAALPTFALLDRGVVRDGVTIRAAAVLAAAVALMLATGGGTSFFVLWAFTISVLYGVVLPSQQATTYAVAVAVGYALVAILTPHGVPVLVHAFRTVVLAGIGWSAASLTAQNQRMAVDALAARDAWAASEERFRSVVAASPVGFLTSDQHGHITLANPFLEAMFGYAPGELTGRKVSDLVPTAARARHEAMERSFHRDERFRTMGDGSRVEGRRKDGTTFPAEVSLGFYEQRGAKHAVACVIDASLWNRMQVSLSAAELRQKSVFDASPVGISLASGPDWRIVEVNPAMLRMFGYEADEMIGRTPPELGLCADREATDVIAEEQLALTGRISELEHTFRRKDGTTGTALGSVDFIGEPPLVLTMIRDITARKQAEVSLEEKLVQQAHLAALGRQAVAGVPTHVLMQDAAQRVAEGLRVPFVNLYRTQRAESRSMLDLVAHVGIELTKECPTRFEINDHTPEGTAALQDEPLVLPDLARDPRFRETLLPSLNLASGVCVSIDGDHTVRGVLAVYTHELRTFTSYDVAFVEALASLLGSALKQTELDERAQRLQAALTEATEASIEGWAAALDLRDHETEGHSRRVTDLAVRFARRLGFEGDDVRRIRRGALLHDIGKMGVPDAILRKPSALTPDERRVVERHTIVAHDLLAGIPFLADALDIPCSHHERWDGRGYPQGLEGANIPMPARLFALIDVYDALTSDRPYRAAWSHDAALAYIRENAGTHFDPRLVPTFLELIQDHVRARDGRSHLFDADRGAN